MREFHSFLEAAVYCGELVLLQHEADKHSLHKATELLQEHVREKFGEYQPEAGPFVEWAQLADSTKADRVYQGYAENEPLLRTGDLRESVETLVRDNVGYVGSDSDIAVYQELGTIKMPPRSTFGSAAVETMDLIVEIVGKGAVAALVGKHVFQGRMEIPNV
jgi:hypothetical protein